MIYGRCDFCFFTACDHIINLHWKRQGLLCRVERRVTVTLHSAGVRQPVTDVTLLLSAGGGLLHAKWPSISACKTGSDLRWFPAIILFTNNLLINVKHKTLYQVYLRRTGAVHSKSSTHPPSRTDLSAR